MELLSDQQPGRGNEIQLIDATARSFDREVMYAIVADGSGLSYTQGLRYRISSQSP